MIPFPCGYFLDSIALSSKLLCKLQQIVIQNYHIFLQNLLCLGSIHFLPGGGGGGGGAEELMSNSMLKLGTPERKVDKKL